MSFAKLFRTLDTLHKIDTISQRGDDSMTHQSQLQVLHESLFEIQKVKVTGDWLNFEARWHGQEATGSRPKWKRWGHFVRGCTKHKMEKYVSWFVGLCEMLGIAAFDWNIDINPILQRSKLKSDLRLLGSWTAQTKRKLFLLKNHQLSQARLKFCD